MAVIPKKQADQLAFFESHFPVWLVAPASVGLTNAQVTNWKTQVVAARAAYDDAQAARNAARSATGQQNSALGAAYTTCADLVRVIKSYAEQQANPQAVYDAAQIPAPAPAAPVGPPGIPTDFSVSLQQDGAVALAWKCANPGNGVLYEVRRRTGSTGAFELLGTVGVRTFTDQTLPSGAANVVYQITGVRSTTRGLPAQFNVNFGIGGNGVSIANVKLAA